MFKRVLYTLFVFSVFAVSPVLAQEALQITNVQIRNIDYTSATIHWTTNTSANSQISYGRSNIDENKSPTSQVYARDHSITLTNLTPGSGYLFQVTSQSPSGETVTSDIMSFSTLSFSFSENSGQNASNFGTLITPTPTPQLNPYASSIPQYPNNYYTQSGTQQPIIVVPPIVYSQQTGQTLGETTTTPTPIVTPAPITVQASSSTQPWLPLILFGVIAILIAIMVNVFQSGRKELRELREKLEEKENKPQGKNRYSFKVS